MPELITAALSLLAVLGTLLAAHLQRKNSPTPQQRADARQIEIDALFEQIATRDRAGELAAADALRRRLRDLLNTSHAHAQRLADGPGQ